MTLGKLVYIVVLFASGVVVGALWSPLGDSLKVSNGGYANSNVPADCDEYLAKLKKDYGDTFGDELVEFVKQCEDMTIRINQYPINAWASPDGRFIIRLFGSNDTTASDLYYPDIKKDAPKEWVRYYSFSCGDQVFSCDFGRNIAESKMTNIQFRITNSKLGDIFTYLDDDADGRWDRFIDYTQDTPVYYHRDGLCWKKKTTESSP